MPSLRELVKTSVSLASFGSNTPESVALSSVSSGGQFIGYFSGWTANFSVVNHGCKKAEEATVLMPVTSFTSSDETITCQWVKDQVQSYLNDDDVFEESFLRGIVLTGGSQHEAGLLSCLAAEYDTELIASTIGTSDTLHMDPASPIPNGPYIAHLTTSHATLGPVYKVYQDDYMAFMNGLLPNGTSGSFRYAPVNTISDSTIGIPVPSKLYARGTPSESKPLEGIRVTVKDIIDVSGVKTSNGNRAWFKFYDAKNASAPSIQKLIDLGAVIIGKTKTAQFANSDRPTADWVDYHDAFNPRGDGYQDPGVSSAGAGAATAAYDWVDVSIATDTGGSIRIPAAKNGVFGLRPSFGAISNEGVMEEGEFFDAVGYHARSPQLLRDFGRAWLADSKQLIRNHTQFPKRIIMPENLWSTVSNESKPIFENWVDNLAGFLDATVETTSIDEFWNATAHADKPNTSFYDHMRMVGFHLIWKNQLENVITPFREAYAALKGGRSPFINPFPAARYETALNTTQEDYDTSFERFTYFKDWFGKNVVKGDVDACSESLFLIPLFTGATSYRNNVYSPPDVGSWATFTPYYFSVQSQGPEAVFPIGQITYMSNITNVEEQLPVVIDVLVHKNCDLMLLDLAKALGDANLLTPVKTGSTLWE